MKIYLTVDLRRNLLANAHIVVENVTSDPVDLIEGLIWWRSDLHKWGYYDGTTIHYVNDSAEIYEIIRTRLIDTNSIDLSGGINGISADLKLSLGIAGSEGTLSILGDGVAADLDINSPTKAMPGGTTLNNIPKPTGDVDMNEYKIWNIDNPQNPTDVANKTYVDNKILEGSDTHCIVATMINITLDLADTPNIDGVPLGAGDRVLVHAQTDEKTNGIYDVTATGTWTRSADADTWEKLICKQVWISMGDTNQDKCYVCTIDEGGGTLGTDAITWREVPDPSLLITRDEDVVFSDITTNDVSTLKHGYMPKLPGDETKFFDGDGNWTEPPSGGGSEAVNIETLTGNKTLTASDAPIQIYTLNYANRTITLPTTGLASGQKFEIMNNDLSSSQYSLTIYDTAFFDKIPAQVNKRYRWDGSKWMLEFNENIAIGQNVSILQYSVGIGKGITTYGRTVVIGSGSGYTDAVGVGYSCNIGNYGVGVGYGVSVAAYSVAVGHQSNTFNYSYCVTIGNNTQAGASYSVAAGSNTRSERLNEFVSTASAGQNKAQMTIQKYREKDLATASGAWQELFTDASSSRLLILAKSVYHFRIQINAIDNTGYLVKTWTLEGAIKRDASNNTTIVGTVAKVVTAADAGTDNWDVQAIADDTNEALKIQVKHDCANNVRYSLNAWSTETRL
ncbi:MAG: hypothetical protein ABFD61_00225 [Chloroherpetonaceae bacterium]